MIEKENRINDTLTDEEIEHIKNELSKVKEYDEYENTLKQIHKLVDEGKFDLRDSTTKELVDRFYSYIVKEKE